MKIISVNHINEITTLDLALIPVHRLCLVNTKEFLGVGIKYLAGSGSNSAVFSTAMLAGILVQGLDVSDTTLAGIARIGFQGGTVERDRELIHDGCRVLRNVINKESQVEEIGAKAEALADFYWWLRPLLLAGAVTDRHERALGEWTTILFP